MSPLEAIRHALLPGIAIAAYGMAEVARQLRGSLLEVLSSQYVRTLHAKGLSMTRILWQHGLKNVSVNLFTIISLLVNRMLAATVVIERQPDGVQRVEHQIAIGLRQRRQAVLHLGDRQIRIVRRSAVTLRWASDFGPDQHVGGHMVR